MTTVNTVERWFDECAEDLVGLPVAEAVRDVMGAGLRVEVARPNVHRVRGAQQSDVSIVADRRGVVVDVRRLDAGAGLPVGLAEYEHAARQLAKIAGVNRRTVAVGSR